MCVAPRGVEAAAHLVGLADLTARSLLARDLGGDGEKRGDLVKHGDGRNMSLEANGRSTLVLGGARSFCEMVFSTVVGVRFWFSNTVREPFVVRVLFCSVRFCGAGRAPRSRTLVFANSSFVFVRI